MDENQQQLKNTGDEILIIEKKVDGCEPPCLEKAELLGIKTFPKPNVLRCHI